MKTDEIYDFFPLRCSMFAYENWYHSFGNDQFLFPNKQTFKFFDLFLLCNVNYVSKVWMLKPINQCREYLFWVYDRCEKVFSIQSQLQNSICNVCNFNYPIYYYIIWCRVNKIRNVKKEPVFWSVSSVYNRKFPRFKNKFSFWVQVTFPPLLVLWYDVSFALIINAIWFFSRLLCLNKWKTVCQNEIK